MSVKSRQLGLTFVVAALGLAVVLMSQGKDYALHIVWKLHLHVAVLLVLAAAKSPPILLHPRHTISLMRGPMTRLEIRAARRIGDPTRRQASVRLKR